MVALKEEEADRRAQECAGVGRWLAMLAENDVRAWPATATCAGMAARAAWFWKRAKACMGAVYRARGGGSMNGLTGVADIV